MRNTYQSTKIIERENEGERETLEDIAITIPGGRDALDRAAANRSSSPLLSPNARDSNQSLAKKENPS